jgi:hypothetical protein
MKLTQEDGLILNERVNRPLLDRRRPLPTTLYHYTTAEGLLGILETQKLWATHYAYLNDPSEVEYGRQLIIEFLTDERTRVIQQPDFQGADRWMGFLGLAEEAVLKARVQIGDPFLACFCEDGDLLSQWRRYGSDGRGYSLGVRPRALDSLGSDGIRLLDVRYDKEEQKRMVSEILNAVFEHLAPLFRNSRSSLEVGQISVKDLANDLIDSLCSFKNPAFEEEKEWRCVLHAQSAGLLWELKDVRFRPGRNGIIPYVEVALSEEGPLPIVEIIAGPGLDGSLAEKALGLLDEKYGLQISVRRSQFSA